MRNPIFSLTLCTCLIWCSSGARAQDSNAPAAALRQTFQDPAVPMIALPTRFKSRREHGVAKGGPPFVVADLKGPGCVRHLWFLVGKDVRLEINVDGAKKSQVDLPLKAFFGIMHDRDEHFVESAPLTVLPGFNSFLPIPFQKSCRITIHSDSGMASDSMIDWHQYDKDTVLTPYRLHAAHTKYTPAPPRGGYVKLADIEGDGFIAGVAMGYIQRNKKDMVFHTGGMTILLDGETDPHVIRGHNVEDDFGFTWGFRNQQTRWLGCPWHENRGRNDQDGTFFRFFGPDPIAFRSSVSFRSGSRGDDMESVVFCYKKAGTTAPKLQTPSEWEVTGLYLYDSNWDRYKEAEYVKGVPVGEWPGRDQGFGEPNQWTLKSDRGWIDLQNLFFDRTKDGSGGTPFVQLGRVAYARTNIESESERDATLRLAVDDWAVVWLNGEKVAALRHDKGLETASIPVKLKKGSNELLVKTNNTDTYSNRRLWVINCVVE
jgi:hypothetical protein